MLSRDGAAGMSAGAHKGDGMKRELPVFVGFGTLIAIMVFGHTWFEAVSDGKASPEDPYIAVALFAWLFPVLLWSAFGVVRHADVLAERLGEPYGTLILTLAVIVIEVSLIAAIMLSGDANPTLARDTMFAVLMIVLNGLVGLALLIGGILHREQDYNLRGARAFFSVLIPLVVFALILPAFTVSTDNPTFTPAQSAFFALVSVLLYGVFLAIQTGRHRGFFQEEYEGEHEIAERAEPHEVEHSTLYHAVFLILNLLPVVLLAEHMAELINYGIEEIGAPTGLGGVVVAALVLAPEGIAAMRSACANQLQRSVNLLLGSALSTIGLTVPAVLIIGLVAGQTVLLGLGAVSQVLLLLTLVLSTITFGGVRTNLLQGAVHLVIFLAYLILLFSP